jgi:Tfp pilus assembly protein PilF
MNRMDLLKQYLEATPEDSFLRHALALEYVALGDDRQAIDLFEALLTHDPDYVGSYYHLGKAYERTGDYRAAAGVYERGMEAARRLHEDHAYRELRQAADEMD